MLSDPYAIPIPLIFPSLTATDGLKYYQDGERVKIKSTTITKRYDKDTKTDLVIGKPNYGDKYFGRFMMDDLVIYYKVLGKDEIWYLNSGGEF